MSVQLLNIDNMEYMATVPDQEFDLAIVDPPYGIGEDWKKNRTGLHFKHDSTYKNDCIPSEEYFLQLMRVSKNQIIWGANYYTEFLAPTNSWIIWDKKRNVEKTFMSEAELAWTSFNIPARFYRQQWDGAKKGKDTGLVKIHPHQKPISLYEWLLATYAEKGQKILDTHLGSCSSAIAAHYAGLDFVGCELDPDYYQADVKRFNETTSQLAMDLTT